MRYFLVMTLAIASLANVNIANAATLTANNFVSRLTTNLLTFDDLTFSNALDRATTTSQISGNVGDSGTFGITVQSGETGFTYVPGAGIAYSNTLAPVGGVAGSFTITITGAQDLSVGHYGFMTAATPAQGFGVSQMLLGNVNGFYTLSFLNNGNGFVKTGGIYVVDVLLPGDWSHQGTGVGQAEFIGVNSGFTITENFVYDSATNQTLIEAVDNNYAASSPRVGLNFVLHGSAVAAIPEPETYAMLLAGLGLLGFASRRKQVSRKR